MKNKKVKAIVVFMALSIIFAVYTQSLFFTCLNVIILSIAMNSIWVYEKAAKNIEKQLKNITDESEGKS
jgi:hypothetical protein